MERLRELLSEEATSLGLAVQVITAGESTLTEIRSRPAVLIHKLFGDNSVLNFQLIVSGEGEVNEGEVMPSLEVLSPPSALRDRHGWVLFTILYVKLIL